MCLWSEPLGFCIFCPSRSNLELQPLHFWAAQGSTGLVTVRTASEDWPAAASSLGDQEAQEPGHKTLQHHTEDAAKGRGPRAQSVCTSKHTTKQPRSQRPFTGHLGTSLLHNHLFCGLHSIHFLHSLHCKATCFRWPWSHSQVCCLTPWMYRERQSHRKSQKASRAEQRVRHLVCFD